MLETCEKQEINFWQDGRAVLDSFHRSALVAEDAAVPVLHGPAGYVRAFHYPLHPSFDG